MRYWKMTTHLPQFLLSCYQSQARRAVRDFLYTSVTLGEFSVALDGFCLHRLPTSSTVFTYAECSRGNALQSSRLVEFYHFKAWP